MKFEIDPENIVSSFSRIAEDLLLFHVIAVNNIELEITEIEFYFLKDDQQEPIGAFEPTLPAGRWRFHKLGLNISLQGSIIQSGGILIHSVRKNGLRVNGPKAVLACIFETMGNVSTPNVLQLKAKKLEKTVIVKQYRSLPKKVHFNDFVEKGYKYAKKR